MWWHRKTTSQVHLHDFKRLMRLVKPVREVWDCGCGVRKIVFVGGLGTPDQEQVISSGNSVENALISVYTDELQGSRLLR